MAVETRENPSAGRKLKLSFSDQRFRAVVYQAIVLALVLAGIGYLASNTIHNLETRGIASGFDFFSSTAGFDIMMSLVPYDPVDSYGRAFLVGLLNTMLVSVLSIILCTILGFFVGILRLSDNWLINKIARAYVEIIRNVPLLLQILFWYFVILNLLPRVRQSIDLGAGFFINNRGTYVPTPIAEPGFSLIPIAGLVAVVIAIVIARWARKRQDATGEQFPVFLTSVGLIVGLPLLASAVTGFPLTFDYPELKGFNFAGGTRMPPEFLALLIALTTYHAGFLAEIVRAGIISVSKGQKEAAKALGLRPNMMMRLVVLPQALRLIIPPQTSIYLNVTKNSSLAVAIGYPDLVSVFTGTTLNQTGQAVEVIFITMLVYLTVSLSISLFMNWYNARTQLVER
ncbi:MAG: amino acid ABC transporter permease [Alphaproteobacteria bacterium]|nr:amino acid ABC transporter permease [Alphaproteobacteria bacterium]